MSNALVKRLCHALECEAEKHQAVGKRETRAALPCASPPAAFGANTQARSMPEEVHAPCFCAKYDRRFLDVLERLPSGLWRPVKSLRIEGPVSRTVYEAMRSVALREIDGRSTPCPWCGNKRGPFHCDCGAVLCGANLRGEWFCCCRCGDEWEVELLPSGYELHTALPVPDRGHLGPALKKKFGGAILEPSFEPRKNNAI